jgi:hypothetical protein
LLQSEGKPQRGNTQQLWALCCFWKALPLRIHVQLLPMVCISNGQYKLSCIRLKYFTRPLEMLEDPRCHSWYSDDRRVGVWVQLKSRKFTSPVYMHYDMNMLHFQIEKYECWPDRLCGLVVRVLGYRSGGPSSIPGTTRKKSSGSRTGSTQPREYNWGATW